MAHARLSMLILSILLLSGCGVAAEQANQTPAATEQTAEKATLAESCIQIAREFQTFFQSDASFANSARSLALGLTIASSEAEDVLATPLATYIDLMQKVDSSVTTNEDFQALVEDKHGIARDVVFSICEREGIKIN